MTNLVKNLKDFGLSDKEAKIYLALLELGSAKVSEVAKHSGINRSSTYVVLEALKKRGLVGISKDKGVQRYVAASPEVLLHTAESEARKYSDVKENIESSMSELKALSKTTQNRPVVQVFEGKEGLISAFENSLMSTEKLMRVASAPANLGPIIYDYIPTYVRKRARLGIKMNGIHPFDENNLQLIKSTPNEVDTYQLIPKKKLKLPADLAVFDDKIGYMSSLGGGLAIIIQDKELAETMKSIFDLAWEEAKRLNKKTESKKNRKN